MSREQESPTLGLCDCGDGGGTAAGGAGDVVYSRGGATRRGFGVGSMVSLLIVVVPLLYVLSMGPAIRLSSSTSAYEHRVYAPVYSLRERCPPFRAGLDWYLWYGWRIRIIA